MNELKLLGHLAREIKSLSEAQEQFISDGRAEDYSEYRHVCGVIRGLAHAANLINDLAKRLEESDD